MAFIYYISGIQGRPTKELLASLEIYEEPGDCAGTEVFVDGSKGVVFKLKGKSNENDLLGYYHDLQTWVNIPDTKLWIGREKNKPIDPEDFIKEETIDGYAVKLGDGNSWMIPRAIKFMVGSVLPETILSLRKGEYKRVVVDKYLELQSIADPLSNLFAYKFGTREDVDVSSFRTEEQQFALCVKVLGVNYNIDYREISLLRLLNSSNLMEVLGSVVDMPYAMELFENEKKKLTQNQSMSFGQVV